MAGEREVVGFGLEEGGFRKMSFGPFFVKTTRTLDFSLLHIEINFTERIYTQNNLASLLFRSDELDYSVISIKRKCFLAKQPGRAHASLLYPRSAVVRALGSSY